MKSKAQKYAEAVARNLPAAASITPQTSQGRLKLLADPSIENARIRVGILKGDDTWDSRLKEVQAKAFCLLADLAAKAAKKGVKEAEKTGAGKAKPALFSVEKPAGKTAKAPKLKAA